MSEPSERRSGLLSRPPDREVRRRRRLSLGGSLLVHAVAFALFALIASVVPSTPTREGAAPAEIVTITRRTPRPAPDPAAAARTPEIARARPAALRVPVPPAIPLPLPRAIPARSPAPVATAASRRRVAYAPALPPGAGAGSAANALSQAKLGALERGFAANIARDRDAIHPTDVAPSTPAPAKEYGPALASFEVGDSRHHHGLCDPIRSWESEGYDYYYVACNVRFSDGTMQRQDVPWPVRFDPKDDPFTGTSGHDLPLAAPLPGWHLAQGEFVSPELREYAKDRGVVI